MTETTTPVEHVLVVPTLLFHEIGHFQGFNANVDPYMETLFDPIHTRYLARPEAEEDPSYKQLIPYCVFRCGDDAFFYTRGSAQGEGRLHAKRSIGVGIGTPSARHCLLNSFLLLNIARTCGSSRRR